MVVVLNQLNSKPKPSLIGMSPIVMLRAVDPEASYDLMGALEIKEMPYEELNLMINAVTATGRIRGKCR